MRASNVDSTATLLRIALTGARRAAFTYVSTESSEVVWLPAAEAADQADRGELAMLPPTYLTCLEIGTLGSVDKVLAASTDRSVTMFMPEVEPLGDGFTLSMPDELRPLVASRRG